MSQSEVAVGCLTLLHPPRTIFGMSDNWVENEWTASDHRLYADWLDYSKRNDDSWHCLMAQHHLDIVWDLHILPTNVDEWAHERSFSNGQ